MPLDADLSRLHAVVPVRSLAGGKARLGGALDAEERETLILGMLAGVLRALVGWEACEAVHVVATEPQILAVAEANGGRPILQAGEGLNEALLLARESAIRAGATALLILPGDLPLVGRSSLERMLQAADAAIAAGSGRPIAVLAPADARGGTNALLLSPADTIDPAFGPRSLEVHARAAAAAEASLQLVVDPELGFDLDTPTDLERLDPAQLAELVALGEQQHIARDAPIPRATATPSRTPASTLSHRLLAIALPALPEVRPGDDLAALIAQAWRNLMAEDAELAPRPGDVLVVTQKVVSKAEGRIVDLRSIEPRPEAVAFAHRFDRDPRQVEVVLRESAHVLRMERGVIVSRTHQGFVCANAGVDASNVGEAETVTLLPVDPDHSAVILRERLANILGAPPPAVIVSDSFGRPWRWGIVDVALGVAGMHPLDDQRGRPDAAGRIMRSTVVAVADEICSAAELASGKTSGRPVVLVRGAPLPAGVGSVARDLLMPAENDLFP